MQLTVEQADVIMVSIILAEDHALVRQGIRRIIEEDAYLVVTHEAGNGLELLKLLEQDSPDSVPDIVVLDISMPLLEGLEAAKIIKQRYPGIKILILTMHREKHYFSRAQEIGVNGYVLKEEADTDLNAAIKNILQGNTYISPMMNVYFILV